MGYQIASVKTYINGYSMKCISDYFRIDCDHYVRTVLEKLNLFEITLKLESYHFNKDSGDCEFVIEGFYDSDSCTEPDWGIMLSLSSAIEILVEQSIDLDVYVKMEEIQW